MNLTSIFPATAFLSAMAASQLMSTPVTATVYVCSPDSVQIILDMNAGSLTTRFTDYGEYYVNTDISITRRTGLRTMPPKSSITVKDNATGEVIFGLLEVEGGAISYQSAGEYAACEKFAKIEIPASATGIDITDPEISYECDFEDQTRTVIHPARQAIEFINPFSGTWNYVSYVSIKHVKDPSGTASLIHVTDNISRDRVATLHESDGGIVIDLGEIAGAGLCKKIRSRSMPGSAF